MNPNLLPKQLAVNANDLQEFCKELKEWSNEMKLKEESLKSDKTENASSECKVKKAKKHTGSGDAPVKSSRNAAAVTDYAAWDKFDVEKACERVDKSGSDKDSELSDEFDESLKDEAMLEKEQGNRFVKNQKWDAAIECYTRAIACYGYDPIFYANRALCFLKKEKWKEAETDCTTALQLDKTYVKAYQRRSAARVKLNQLADAKTDLDEVLKYEPKNSESTTALITVLELLKKEGSQQKTTTKPVSKFTQQRQHRKNAAERSAEEKAKVPFDISKAAVVERKLEDVKRKSPEVKKKPEFTWPKDDSLDIIKPISKAPHLRSKVPLKRIKIKDIEAKSAKFGGDFEAKKDAKKKSVSFGDFEAEKKTNHAEETVKDFVEPITSVQFFAQWKQFDDDVNLKYEYLRVLNPKNLKEVFKESLDSKTFSDILKVLSKHCEDHDFVYNFLLGLVEVKRFCTLVFFMSKADKNGVKTIADSLKTGGKYSEDDIKNVLKSFDL